MKSFMTVMLLLTCIVSVPSTGIAAKYREIDAEGVKTFLDAGALVVNPMTPVEYGNEHIASSVNIPIELLASAGVLPGDKAAPIVFYCLNQRCVYSWRAAEKAADLGYANLYVFRGGIAEWKAAGHAVEAKARLPDVELRRVGTDRLAKMLEQEDMVLLDINSEEDAAKFWIDTPRRIYIPLSQLKARYTALPKDKKIVVVCLKGQRGPTAIRYLASKGFKDLQLLEGGVQKWVLEGRPIKKSR